MKRILFLWGVLILFPLSVKAVCPVCTIVIAGGVGLSRYLGIDDLISGTWMGGLLISLVIWTIDFLNKRKIRFFGRKPLILIFWYGITILPLHFIGILGHPQNTFWGIDKLIFGIIAGSVGFLVGYFLDLSLRKKNQGKVFFPFQKVILPVLILLILSFIFLRLTKMLE